MGRGWTHPPLEGFQTHVSKNLLKQIGVAPNKDEKAALRFDAISILHVRYFQGVNVSNVLIIIIDVFRVEAERR